MSRQFWDRAGYVAGIVAWWGIASAGLAWGAPWRASGGPVTVTLEPLGAASAPGVPVAVKLRIDNGGGARLAGTVAVGGPTGDLHCVGEPSRPFQVAPGETAEVAFEVAFLPGAVAGSYPVHGFVEFLEGAEGVLEVARTVEVSFPAGSGTTPEEASGRAVARVRAGVASSGLDGLLEQWRLEVLEEFVRETGEPVEGGLFRLSGGSGEDGGTRVAVLPGEQGLLDAWWLVVGPEGAFRFRGLHLALDLPDLRGEGSGTGPELEVEVARPRTEPETGDGARGMAWEHFLSCGEWTTSVTVTVDVDDSGPFGALRLRAECPDRIAEFGPGPASVPLAGVVDRVGAVHRVRPVRGEGASFRVWRYAEAGWNLEERGGPEPGGRAWTLALCPRRTADGGVEVALSPEDFPAPDPAAARKSEVGRRLWWDAGPRRFGDVKLRLEEFQAYGPGPVGVILGGMRRPGGAGEIWPPDPELGGVESLLELSEAARSAGVVLAPDLALDRVWPLSATFDFGGVAFGTDGRPREIPGSGGAYRVRAEAGSVTMREFPALAGARAVVLGEDQAEPEADRHGRVHGGEEVAASWAALLDEARGFAGEETWLFLRGKGGSGAPLADARLEGARARPEEGVLPFPWPEPCRPVTVRPLADSGPLGDWLAVVHGDGVAVGDQDGLRDWVRAAWFVRALAMAGTGTRAVELVDGNPGRLRIRRGEAVVTANASGEAWETEGRVLPPWGFHVAANEVSGGRETRDGVTGEWLEAPGARYVRAGGDRRAEAPGCLGAEMALAEPGVVRVDSRWKAGTALPFGARPVAVIHPVEDPWNVVAEVPLDGREPGHRWSGEVTAGATWEPGELAVGDYGVRLLCVASSGRALPLTGADRSGDAGPHAGWAVLAGMLSVQRVEEGKVAELEFRPEALAEPKAAEAVDAASVDLGWALTDGGFRWERHETGMRVTPLPDSLPFAITLRPQALGVTKEQVTAWRRIPLVPAEAEAGESPALPLPWEGDALRWRHDPEFLAYEFDLAAADESDGTGCGSPEPR